MEAGEDDIQNQADMNLFCVTHEVTPLIEQVALTHDIQPADISNSVKDTERLTHLL